MKEWLVKITLSIFSIIGTLSTGWTTFAAPPQSKRPPLRYPPPPDSVRIQYLQEFRSAEDLGIKAGLWSRLGGKSEMKYLVQPMAVCVGKRGAIYVADGAGAVFAFQEKKRVKVRNFPTPLPQWTAMCKDAQDRLYLLDGLQNRVMVLNSDLEVLQVWQTALERASGIAIDDQNRELFLGDVKQHRIVVYSLDGKLIRHFGSAGDSTLGLHFPTHLFFKDGVLYVTDALNFRIKKFRRDGTLIASIGRAGNASGTFSRPKGIALDSQNHLYVVDALFGNVQIFNENGDFLMHFGKSGSGYGEFNLPNGIWIDERDRVYIADTYNRRIQVYQFYKTAIAHTEKD